MILIMMALTILLLQHLLLIPASHDKVKEIAYGTSTSFVARNVSRFGNRLNVSRSGNRYNLNIRDLKISDEARFTAHALFEERNGTDAESRYFVDKAVVNLITQGRASYFTVDTHHNSNLFNSNTLSCPFRS